MKLGIMQPYFFPYIGYYSLIAYCDEFVFFDTPQYIERGWINRNRILKQNGGTVYITVPTRKTPRSTAIKDIAINNDIKWKDKIYGQLSYYKKKAPYYKYVIDIVQSVLEKKEDSLATLCIDSINTICDELGIYTKCRTFSEMAVDVGIVNAPDEWALKITKEMGFDTYVNPPGGVSFFDRQKYIEAGIWLEFLKQDLKPYIQRTGDFESGLSIIDVMMFCSVKDIKQMLKEFKIM